MSMRPHPAFLSRRRAGFTLVELMIGAVLALIVIGGATSFVIYAGRMIFVTEEKIRINDDIRDLTNEMTDVARDANLFQIFTEFGSDKSRPQYSGETGDMLVLVFQDQGYPEAPGIVRRITRVVGYYRDRGTNNRGPVRRFDTRQIWPTGLPHPAGSATNPRTAQPLTLEEILARPEIMNREADFPVVVELARGLANQSLFYNHLGRSVVMNAQIIRGSVVKEVTDTYNFTISPRG